MLLQFSCQNHKSIKEKVTFSSYAGKDDAYEENLKSVGKMRVYRMAAIYGANGSGKSNFFHAISFVRAAVVNSMNHQPGETLYQNPHRLSDKDCPSSYDIQFIRKGMRYAYGFSIVNKEIDEEYLYYFPRNRQTKIFERKGNSVKPGSKFKKNIGLSIEVLKSNRLFLSCSANYSSAAEIENAYMFFRDEMVFYNPEVNNWKEYSAEIMQNNPEIKRDFVSILNAIGTELKDIKVKSEKRRFDIDELPADMPEVLKEMLTSQENNFVEAKLVYDQFEINLEEESSGIQKLFEIVCPIIDVLSQGKVLFIDEIESGLHEAVVKRILEIFQSNMKEEFAQIFFTTHDTSLLSSVNLRRDQIWFTELNDERCTDLYSLVEVKNVRKEHNYSKGYIEGKYGAIPMLDPQFSDILDRSM